MKKMFASLILTCVFFCAASANSLMVVNILTVPVTLSIRGVNPSGVVFNSANITFMPGNTIFPDAAALPGTVPAAAIDGRMFAAFGACVPPNLVVGSPNIGGFPFFQSVPAGNGCNNGVPFNLQWNEPNVIPYDAVLVIF